MASDYGDDAGEKMIEDFMRFGERMGERVLYPSREPHTFCISICEMA